jgi:copper chaperone CopZ
MKTLVLEIDGMQSGACAGNIEKRLYGVHGVQSAVVSFSQESAEIAYDPSQTDVSTLAKAVAEAGYTARLSGAAMADEPVPATERHTNSGCG